MALESRVPSPLLPRSPRVIRASHCAQLPQRQLCMLLGQDELRTDREERVFEAVVAWYGAQARARTHRRRSPPRAARPNIRCAHPDMA
eukprot:2033879-Prymnesium_polylepis.1